MFRIRIAGQGPRSLASVLIATLRGVPPVEIKVPCCTRCKLRRILVALCISGLPLFAAGTVALAWNYTGRDFYAWFAFLTVTGLLVSPRACIYLLDRLQPARLLGMNGDLTSAWVDFPKPAYVKLLHEACPERVTLSADVGRVAEGPPKRPVRRR